MMMKGVPAGICRGGVSGGGWKASLSIEKLDLSQPANPKGKIMKCEICGKGMREGVTLIRQNPKGEFGVWRCEFCNKKFTDQKLQNIIAHIQWAQSTATQKGGNNDGKCDRCYNT